MVVFVVRECIEERTGFLGEHFLGLSQENWFDNVQGISNNSFTVLEAEPLINDIELSGVAVNSLRINNFGKSCPIKVYSVIS